MENCFRLGSGLRGGNSIVVGFQPARCVQSVQKKLAGATLHVPNHASHRLPFPEQQEQCQAGEQHIGAAFDWSWQDASPRPLKPLSRHQAVLDRKQSEQGSVDRQGIGEGSVRSGVNRLRNGKASYKANGVTLGCQFTNAPLGLFFQSIDQLAIAFLFDSVTVPSAVGRVCMA